MGGSFSSPAFSPDHSTAWGKKHETGFKYLKQAIHVMHDLVPPKTLILKQDPLASLPVKGALERPANVGDERGALCARQRHVHATHGHDLPHTGDEIVLVGSAIKHGGIGGGELDHVHFRLGNSKCGCFYGHPLQLINPLKI
jgi:hypothetical protein